ncbi:MAG: hypothetical protein KDA51_02555, partial [Planctomycetales bacterium]|nr:hypothetical protein [Planctomycetales bacterium]
IKLGSCPQAGMGPMQNRDVWYNERLREGRAIRLGAGLNLTRILSSSPFRLPTNYVNARRDLPSGRAHE